MVIGDEEGELWTWSVVDGVPLSKRKEKAHGKAITWTEYRGFQEDSKERPNEMITASADGTVKVWRDSV